MTSFFLSFYCSYVTRILDGTVCNINRDDIDSVLGLGSACIFSFFICAKFVQELTKLVYAGGGGGVE